MNLIKRLIKRLSPRDSLSRGRGRATLHRSSLLYLSARVYTTSVQLLVLSLIINFARLFLFVSPSLIVYLRFEILFIVLSSYIVAKIYMFWRSKFCGKIAGSNLALIIN